MLTVIQYLGTVDCYPMQYLGITMIDIALTVDVC